jgi:hypothetical protein
MTRSNENGSWFDEHERLAALARRQLFFVGGAPRSGTTWLQHLLNAHPDISCRGEGLFQQELAKPLSGLMANRRQALANKNSTTFKDFDGYGLPAVEDTEVLLATAILLELRRQCAGSFCGAVGEKTPENVFLFPRLKRLFPRAKFIGVVRDPRDSLSSAWHFWAKPNYGAGAASQEAFVRASLPAIEDGLRRCLDHAATYPDDCRIFTYETLLRIPEPIVAGLCRFLDVSDDPSLVRECVAAASFARLSGGRAAGTELDTAFLRKGVAGDWVNTLQPGLADVITHQLGWAFEEFGWSRT